MGKKKQPFYRIVAADSRRPRDGKYLENLGFYNPRTHPLKVEINEERALYWLRQGAIPTDTVRSLFRRSGILLKWDLMRRGYDEARIEEELKKWEVLQIERRKRLEAAEIQKRQQQTEPEPEEAAPEPEAAATPVEVEEEQQTQEASEAAPSEPEETADSGESEDSDESEETEQTA
jgi:small subunit ribosomal protein S16